MSRHIFFDNSNIFGGAQREAERLEPFIPWVAIRIYYRNLFRLIEGRGTISTRVLSGSVPPGNDPLWQTARDLGYDTNLLRRVENDDGRMVEQAVDEMLHLKIANTILDNTSRQHQCLVIASGDGNVSEYDTSFPLQAERALRQGWEVEIWSWSLQMTTRYASIADANSGKVHINSLDPYYASVTFVKGGGYRFAGDPIHVQERVVSPLRF